MIRQRVTFHGTIFPLPPPETLPGCTVPREHVGVIKVGPVRKWLDHKRRWEVRYRQTHARIRKRRLEDMKVGYQIFGEGEVPPPTALAGRRRIGGDELEKKKVRSLGLSLWSLWGSKHDQMTVKREGEADKGDMKGVGQGEGEGARTFSDIQRQEGQEGSSKFAKLVRLRPSHRRLVTDERQVEGDGKVVVRDVDEQPAMGFGQVDGAEKEELLSPGKAMGEKGVTGKRVFIEGLATPFSLRKEAETASMITLQPSRPATPGLGSVLGEASKEEDVMSEGLPSPDFATPMVSPGERPALEKFVTAQEIPQVKT